jgi:two-component system phosphate regulon sensor histidine kinase PhoR
VNKESSKFSDIVTWPEFQVVWVFVALIATAFVVDYIVLENPLLLFIEGALLFVILVLITSSIYRAAATDRRMEIERSELDGLLNNMDDAVIVYDKNFRANFFNPAAERLFKIRAPSIIGHVFSPRDVETAGWHTLVQVMFPSLAPRIIMRSNEGEYPQVVDASFTDPALELRITTAPLRDDGGRPVGFMKIIRNRTTLLEAIRSKSEFITVASHQLRGPVTDIKWALDALANSVELNDTNRIIVQNASAAGEGLLRRIEDLLSIAKMEEGQFGYAFEEANIVDYIGKVLADLLPAAQKAGIKLYFDRPAGDLPNVTIDPKRLALVFQNLIENAIRYNVENGEIIVKTDKAADKPFVVVSIKDTGIGIAPEDIPKLFNKFYRAENAIRAQTEGSGLGLYIVKGIVNAHGGEIWVESELNRGTTFTFALPTDPNLVPKHEAGGEYLL